MSRKSAADTAHRVNAKMAAADRAKQNRRQEVSDSRRANVYRSDVEHTGDETLPPLPKKGTPERAALVAKVKELRDQGWTYLQIESELNISSAYNLLKEHQNHVMPTQDMQRMGIDQDS